MSLPAHDRDHPAIASGALLDRETAVLLGRRRSRTHIGGQLLKLASGARSVRGAHAILELVHSELTIRAGVPEHLHGALAIGIGGAELG